MSAWSAIIGGAVDSAQNLGYRYLDQNLSKHNTSYSANKSLSNSTALTAFQSQVGRQDYKWQKALDYYYDENQYYDLARKYSENSAKWNVTGLRNAGINPVLAATDGNFASTYGSGASGGSMPSPGASQSVGFSNSHGSITPLTESIRDFASASLSQSSAKLNDVNTKVAEETAPSTIQQSKANVRRVEAETDQIAANTARTLADIENERARVENDSFGLSFGGSSGRKGYSSHPSANGGFHVGGHALKSAFDKIMNFISSGSSRSDNTAKSQEQRSPASDNSSAKSQDESDKHEVRFTIHGVPYYVPRKPVKSADKDEHKPKRKSGSLLFTR